MKRFNSILLVGAPEGDPTPELAQAVALAHQHQAHLTILDVITTNPIGTLYPEAARAEVIDALVSRHWSRWEAAIAPYCASTPITIEIRVGVRFIEVIRAVLAQQHDLVIKTAEAPDWMQRLFGSDDMHLLRKCPCPVWILSPWLRQPAPILVAAVDVSLAADDPEPTGLNRQIVQLASTLAQQHGWELHLLHVVEIDDNPFWPHIPSLPQALSSDQLFGLHQQRVSDLVSAINGLRMRQGEPAITPVIHLPVGSARQTLPQCLRELDAQLIVMGTVARTGLPGFIIGNTAESILEQLACSVLAVKPPGFVSPVQPAHLP